MAKTAADVLRVARSQIGYTEGANNKTKYGTAYGVQGWWCQAFAWWVFREAGAFTEMPKTNVTRVAYPWYRKHRSIVSVASAQPGDVVWFDYSNDPEREPVSHVGIVEKNLGGGKLQTIEGNCPKPGTSGPDGVWQHVRRSLIVAVGRPNYLTGDDMPLTDDDVTKIWFRDVVGGEADIPAWRALNAARVDAARSAAAAERAAAAAEKAVDLIQQLLRRPGDDPGGQ